MGEYPANIHERLWDEWYALWHDADASKPKPSYEQWLEARIEALERKVKKALMHLEISICECGFHLSETDAADALREAGDG